MKKLIKFCIYLPLILIGWMVACNNSGKGQRKQEADNPQDNIKSNKDSIIKNQERGSMQEGKYISDKHYNPAYLELTGHIRGGGNANVIFDQLNIGEINPLESVVIDPTGTFTIKTTIPEPGIYQLRLPNGVIHLFLRGGKVEVNSDISKLYEYKVTGSIESMQLREMYLILDKFNAQIEAIQHRIDDLGKDKTRVKELLRVVDSSSTYNARIGINKAKVLKTFIDKIDTSAIALLASFYLEPFDNYDYLKKIIDKFNKISPYSKFYKQLDEKLKKVVPTTSGHFAPQIIMEGTEGKEISLNSLRGKNVLLYFWVSTDKPSREVNPKLKSIYNRYKQKGFEIYAVSLDSHKIDWKTAIMEDKIDWINVCNTEGWKDESVQRYRPYKTPYFILIDRQGKITARDIKYSELESLISQLP